MTNPLDNAFGLPPQKPTYDVTVSKLVEVARNDSATEDFNFARANVRETMENANDAIAKLASIADQSQEPRAFEVLAQLLKVSLEGAKDLMTMQEKIRKLERADTPHNEEAKKTVTNNLFVGSTSDLAKVIEQMKKD